MKVISFKDFDNSSEENFDFKLDCDPILVSQSAYVARKNLALRCANTKVVGEIRGSTKKPFRQKGTGNARQGSTRAVHMRGGSVVFGPKAVNVSYSFNKKQKKQALALSIAKKASVGELFSLNEQFFSSKKTKDYGTFFKQYGKSVLIHDGKSEFLCIRNLKNVHMVNISNLNILDVLNYKNIFVHQNTLQHIKKYLNA